MLIQSKRFWNKKYISCLGNMSDIWVNYMEKKTGLNGCVSDFSVGFKTFDTSNSINIYKYLMKNPIENNV